MSRLKEKYEKEVVPELMRKFGYKNVMQVPRLNKIVLNIGLGEAIQNPKALEGAEKDLVAISGQHPVWFWHVSEIFREYPAILLMVKAIIH